MYRHFAFAQIIPHFLYLAQFSLVLGHGRGYLRPQLLQMIPPRVRRQQVVLVHPQERQLRPTIEAGMSIEMVVVAAAMGQLRVERTRR